MKIIPDTGFTYDDLLIVPQFSDVKSRSSVNTSVSIGTMNFTIPIIAANMDTICEWEMAQKMHQLGGLGILHRFAPIEEQIEWVKQLTKNNCYAVVSVGVGPEAVTTAEKLLSEGATGVCLDVAHGHSAMALGTAQEIRKLTNNLIVGNIATREAVVSYSFKKIDCLKVGIGPGSACETRIVAGVGVPQAYAVSQCAEAAKELTHPIIIADGGIKTPADVAKAIGLGADMVMVGGLLAGTDETPARGKKMFRGMASSSAQLEHRGKVSNAAAEGATFEIERKGSVVSVIEYLVGGLRSAMSYTGSRNILDFQTEVKFMKVTASTVMENHPHFKSRNQ